PLSASATLFPYTTLFRSKVQKHFMQVLMDRIDSLQDADWVLEELDNLTDQEYQNLLGDEDIEETLVSENVDDVISLVAKRYLMRSEEHTSELQSRFDLVC